MSSVLLKVESSDDYEYKFFPFVKFMVEIHEQKNVFSFAVDFLMKIFRHFKYCLLPMHKPKEALFYIFSLFHLF